MKWAILSDVHGNLEALQAVLQETEREGVNRLVCLGDAVGYGADPNACVLLLRERTDLFVAGNHDWGAVGLTDVSFFNPLAKAAIAWTARVLTRGSRSFLQTLPLVRELNEFTFFHASPLAPEEWNYILSIPEAKKEFRGLAGDLAFFGHSHLPLVWVQQPDGEVSVLEKQDVMLQEGRRYMINVGSVGQPRDGDPRAKYVIFVEDPPGLEVRLVPYDTEITAEKIIKRGFAESYADCLRQGAKGKLSY